MDKQMTLSMIMDDLAFVDTPKKVFLERMDSLLPRKEFTDLIAPYYYDGKCGIVHDLEVTAANAHDVTGAKDLLTGEEEEVYGDSGYLGIEKREGAVRKNTKGQKIRYKINKRPSQCRQGTNRSKGQVKRREREKSKVRAKVEHVFGIIKGQFRYRKTRYRGLMKGKAKRNILFASANRITADRNDPAV